MPDCKVTQPRIAGYSYRIVSNAFLSSAGWTLTVIVNLVITPFLIKRLGMEGFGIYVLLTSLVGYYSLLDIGLGQGIIKYVAEYHAKGDNNAVSASINAALLLQLMLGICGSLLLVIFATPLLGLLKVPTNLWHEAYYGLLLCAGGFLFTMLTGTMNSILMGLQRYDLTSGTSALINLSMTCAMAVALVFGCKLFAIVLINVVFALVSFVVLLWLVIRHLPEWRLTFRPDLKRLNILFSFSGYIFLSRISNTFSNYIVRFIIGSMLGPAAVTLFVVPSKLITAIAGLLSSASGVLFPFASELGAKEDAQKIKQVYFEGSRLFAVISIPSFLALAIFSYPILSLWLGEEFARKSWFICSLLALSTTIGSLTTVPNLVTLGLGYSKIIGLFSIATIIVYVIFLPLLTHFFGVIGSAYGILTATVPGIILVVYLTRILFHFSLTAYIRDVMYVHLPGIILGISLVVLFALIGPFHLWTALGIGIMYSALNVGWLLVNGALPIDRFAGIIRRGKTV